MNDTFKTFPSSVNEALALEYVKSRDLSNLTAREIMRLYDEALKEITDEAKVILSEKRAARSGGKV